MRARTLTVATCNLYNLNEPGLPVYTDRDGWDSPTHALKVAWTAAMLRRAPSDVFGFQELWHADSLRAVVAAAGLADDYAVLAPPGHAGQRIVCAAAVRRDMLEGEPQWIADFPDGFRLESRGDDPQTSEIAVAVKGLSRPVLRFAIRPRDDAPAVQVFVCHFKSKGPTRIDREGWYRADADRLRPHRTAIGAALSTIRRTAEATALRMILTGVMKETATPVVVLGDLNDDHNSNTLNILTEQPRYLKPLAEGGGDNALYSGQALQELRTQRDVYYTHIWNDIHGSLDHVLVSEQFYDNSRRRLWSFDGLDMYNDHLNDAGLKLSEGAADHGVIRARFSWQPAPAPEARERPGSP